jgi:hypothetical protein
MRSFFRLQYGYRASVFPCWREVLPAEDRVKQFRKKGYRELRKMSEGPVRYTVRALSLTNLESLDGLKNLSVSDGGLPTYLLAHDVG